VSEAPPVRRETACSSTFDPIPSLVLHKDWSYKACTRLFQKSRAEKLMIKKRKKEEIALTLSQYSKYVRKLIMPI
jgi:hypothetical protein